MRKVIYSAILILVTSLTSVAFAQTKQTTEDSKAKKECVCKDCKGQNCENCTCVAGTTSCDEKCACKCCETKCDQVRRQDNCNQNCESPRTGRHHHNGSRGCCR